MVFPFFRKGKGPGKDEPQTILPPRPAIPQGQSVTQAPPAEPLAAPAQEEADWDELLVASTPTAESYSAVEEAAVLYANERVAEAIAVLESFLEENGESRDLQPWLLLFDLYQSQGMKQQFDELSMKFVVRFERSAPVWEPERVLRAAPAEGKRSRPAATGPGVVLKGRVEQAAEEAIQRLFTLAKENERVRLDLTQVQAIDASRAKLLAEIMMMVRKAGKSLALAGGREFTALIESLVRGERRREEAYWRLLFELYEFQNLEREFEDAAVDYAVTFEVSPPSWEPMAQAVGEGQEETSVAAETNSEVFRLEGVLDAAAEYRLRELERHAETRSEVVVDLSGLARVDFTTIGSVIGTLIKLHAAGKKVVLSGPNEMVHAFLEVMGVREYATLVRRKAR